MIKLALDIVLKVMVIVFTYLSADADLIAVGLTFYMWIQVHLYLLNMLNLCLLCHQKLILPSGQVPEETQLIFRAPASSLECCCFISNQEFLSGSDDGRIEHWNILRKKPVHIIKNAHGSMSVQDLGQTNIGLSNGRIGKIQFICT